MGLSLYFYIGNLEKIEAAVRDCDFHTLYDPEVCAHRADFSLHLQPRDLDTLSRQIGSHSQQVPVDLRPNLVVRVDEEGYGLLIVDSAWVLYVARIDLADVPAAVEGWFRAVQAQYSNEQIAPTPEAAAAVDSLVRLCKLAEKTRQPVSHVWFA